MRRHWMIAICCLALSLSAAAPALAKVSYSGGKGTSIEDAVIIKAANTMEGILAEREYIERHFPGWQKKAQTLLDKGKRVYDEIKICRGLTCKSLYFDVTSFFGKW